MGRPVSNSREFEKRLRQIEREKEALRRKTEALKKTVALPPATPAAVAPPVAHPPPTAPVSPVPETSEAFAWQPRVAPPPASPAAPAPHAYAPPTVSRDHHAYERFRNYYGSGSFLPAQGSPQDRRIKRNKAIFMLCLVLLCGYIVFWLFFH